MRILRHALLIVPVPVLFGVSVASAQSQLLPHRAIYDLSMSEATDRSGINNIDGRMVYEFSGSECDGYTVTFRFVMRIEANDSLQLSDQQTSTFEDPSGKTFHFVTRIFLDHALDKEVKGVATLGEGETVVNLDKPEKRVLNIGQAKFPTAHLKELLQKAADGTTFYQTTLFDGSEDADKAMLTSVTIGKPKPVAEGDPERNAMNALANDTFWPVAIAYFGGQEEHGEELPDYSISFLLHESGITRDLEMDYGEFSIHGELTGLSLFDEEETACDPQ